ncbi:hypothetical protein V2J09_015585 [Rumex salicifolius]
MATMSRSESKHLYSWWWASHISPKNSKWLQENLTDMDVKVKLMIKSLEGNEDSFARRAEMYYKRRPELMKLVEEFYRAYRALAERYDHATGVIRQAHKTMAEAFPSQVPYIDSDDGSFGLVNDSDPRTPEMIGLSFDSDDSHKGALSPSEFHSADRNGAFGSKESPFAKFTDGRARRGLNFHDADKKGVSDVEYQTLKESLAKLEAEKEAELLQYQKSLEKLSNLESELQRAQEDSRGFHERASKAESEVQSLKDSLAKLEGEKDDSLRQYQQCLDRISCLESNVSSAQEEAERLDKRASEALEEAQALEEELAQLKVEKEDGLAKYMEALENIGNLENKLLLAEDKASHSSERADKAEKEVVALKEALARVTEEKEAVARQYEQCLEKIAALESEIAISREEASRLRDEMDQRTAKLKGVEKQCLLLERSNNSMQTELDSVLIKLGIQNQELSEKQTELGRLWTGIQEERGRVMEAETALRTLEGLHSKTEEELRTVAAELQKRVQILKDMEVHNQDLQGEIQKMSDENKSLNELSISSAFSMKNMQDEILNLKEGKDKLQEELELRLDQRNALQQEIYCLKEELNDLNKKHQAMSEQVESLGFHPESFGSSVKDLQDENSKLKEACQSRGSEISALMEKLSVMEKLIETKSILEHSLSEISVELEDARGKVKALEESCQLLMNEKSTVLAEKAALISQLAVTTENLEKLSERNTLLENSLYDANAELEALRTRSKNLEDSCQLLSEEKSILINERQALEFNLKTAHNTLEELGRKHAGLEQSYLGMEEERESTLRLVEDLRISLAAERKERDNSTQLSHMQIGKMESKICVLQELLEQTRGQMGEELEKAVDAQFEIFVLQKSLQDLKEANSYLLNKCEKMLQTSMLSKKLISELEYENTEQQEEVSFLSDQIKRLRMGMLQLLKVLEVDLDYVYEGSLDEDQMVLRHILVKLDDTRSSLCNAWDENQKLVIEKSVFVTLLRELKQEVTDLRALIGTLQQEFRARNDQLTSLQRDMLKLLHSNEELLLRVRDGNHKEELLALETESLRANLLKMQSVCQDLQEENCRILEENRNLSKALTDLDEEKNKIEHDNSCLVAEAVTLDTLSLIFKSTALERSELIDNLSHDNYCLIVKAVALDTLSLVYQTNVLEKSELINHLIVDMDKLYGGNSALQDKMRIMEAMIGEYQTESMSLKASLESYECEVRKYKTINSELEHEIADGKNTLSQKVMELFGAEAVKDNQQKQIDELSEKYDQQLKESECLRESIQNLDAELCRMHEKDGETNKVVEVLHSDLEKGKYEAELWETVAGSFFVELQSSTVREALYREKLYELTKEYECLEDKSNANEMEALQLRQRVGLVEGENSQIKAQWAGYIPAVASLTDSVASLEKLVMHTKLDDGKDQDASSSYALSNGEAVTVGTSDGFSDLQDISARIKAVEIKVEETKKLVEERTSLSLRSPKSQSSRSRRLSSRSSRRFSSEHPNQMKQTSDPHEAEDGIFMKDIVLDQATDYSSHGRKNRKDSESGDQILEVWENIDQSGSSIDLSVGRAHKDTPSPPKNSMKGHSKSRHYSSESLVEKELRIDSLEISKRFSGRTDLDNNKKILERLSSDVQKLTNLQITVQDLKQKESITETKGDEYANVKDRLDEADRAIVKLLEVNGKLVKNVEDCSNGTSSSIGDSSEIGGSTRRRKVSDQARRFSEKIGRLQLEVQKLQFLLLKLDGSKSKGRASETQMVGYDVRKVVLRDYLYGAAHTPRRKKRSVFCGCVRPSTNGD